MSWQFHWGTISRRIGGFLEAVGLFSNLFRSVQEETGISGKYEHINRVLIPQAKDVFLAVTGLWDTYGDTLPRSATEALQFYSKQLQGASSTGFAGLLGMATILAAMKSELDYLLADQETVTITAVERAFEHLQRTIIVDDQQCRRWRLGFLVKETTCEKMGATHLLWHGIWAFKVNAAGERTDLVLGIPIEGPVVKRVRASGSRLVLTEWKLVRQQSRVKAAAKQAVIQMKRYSHGSLAGIELQSARYIVVVSEGPLNMPLDYAIDGIMYRFVNLVISPLPPSKSKI